MSDVYFPEFDSSKKFWKTLAILAGVLAVLFVVIYITTPREKLYDDSYLKTQLDSLTKQNTALQSRQAELDSIAKGYQIEIYNLDYKLSNIKEVRTVVKEYYHDASGKVRRYNKNEVDSFFRNRYNY